LPHSIQQPSFSIAASELQLRHVAVPHCRRWPSPSAVAATSPRWRTLLEGLGISVGKDAAGAAAAAAAATNREGGSNGNGGQVVGANATRAAEPPAQAMRALAEHEEVEGATGRVEFAPLLEPMHWMGLLKVRCRPWHV